MIRPAISDIGRRVTYDARPHIAHLSHGRLTGIVSDRVVEVLFDGDKHPLRVFSNLRWADGAKA